MRASRSTRAALAILAATVVGCDASQSKSSSRVVHQRVSATTNVVVRSAITGRSRWSVRVPGRCGHIAAVGNGYLVINREVLDRSTGKRLWHAPGASGWGSSMGSLGGLAPVVGGAAIVVVRDGKVQGREPRTGRVAWTRRQRWIGESQVFVGPTTVVGVPRFAPGATTTAATAWDRRTGREKWSTQIPSPGFGTSVTRRALVIVEGTVNRVQGLDIDSGAAKWWTWLPAGGPDALGVDSGVAVLLGPAGVEGFDDASGLRLWDQPGLDQFRVQPGSGLAFALHGFATSARLIDVRTGAVVSEVAASQSELIPVSKTRFVRVGLAPDYEGLDASQRVVWRVPKLSDDEMHVVGSDMVTMSNHCDQG